MGGCISKSATDRPLEPIIAKSYPINDFVSLPLSSKLYNFPNKFIFCLKSTKLVSITCLELCIPNPNNLQYNELLDELEYFEINIGLNISIRYTGSDLQLIRSIQPTIIKDGNLADVGEVYVNIIEFLAFPIKNIPFSDFYIRCKWKLSIYKTFNGREPRLLINGHCGISPYHKITDVDVIKKTNDALYNLKLFIPTVILTKKIQLTLCNVTNNYIIRLKTNCIGLVLHDEGYTDFLKKLKFIANDTSDVFSNISKYTVNNKSVIHTYYLIRFRKGIITKNLFTPQLIYHNDTNNCPRLIEIRACNDSKIWYREILNVELNVFAGGCSVIKN
jgi:hypothetical protein